MIVTVVAVRMVQVAFHKVIDVVAVWDRRMATVGAVLVCLFMSRAAVLGSAISGVGRSDG